MTTTVLRHALAACLCLIPLALHAAQPPRDLDATRLLPERVPGPGLQSPPPQSADPFSEELSRLIEEGKARENAPELALTLLNAWPRAACPVSAAPRHLATR